MDKERIVIVEGITDKKKLKKVLDEDIEIICTHGTLGVERMEELILDFNLDDRSVYILVDEDDSGNKLRKQLTEELPHAEHIYIDKAFREVAATPEPELARALLSRHFSVKPIYLI
ncbi:toprim domain-containing protein [Halobacillus sp. BBL2006]|jgi:toprim domain protein|uniref:toprim domain-containing protein n=1 Tax=Halobacillus sp. BBL2006 TaxID=1543706 RepID=UPI0005441580|nr:toprim domain-containing protein [Halobacillus sp. BBL2006]KHE68672.1 topoisomerase [Halobacillus sp. BBL2006]